MYAKSPGETTAGTLSCLMPVFLDFLHGYEFQSQFTDERLDLLPVLHGDVFQRSLVLSFLLPAHGVLLLPVISTGRGNGVAAVPLRVRQAVPPSLPGPGVPVQASGHLPSLNETSRSQPPRPWPSPAGWIRDAG